MTAADIILIFIGIIGLLIAFGSFVIAVANFRFAKIWTSLDRDKDHKQKNNAHPVYSTEWATSD